MDEITDLAVQNILSKQTPYGFIHDYAVKTKVDLKCMIVCIDQKKKQETFECTMVLDKYVYVGNGFSKKEAKHAAAFQLMKRIIQENSELIMVKKKELPNKGCDLEDKNSITDVSPSIMNDLNSFCKNNHLKLPTFEILREGEGDSKLYTVGCHLSNMVEIATHKYETHAKHLTADKMLNKLMAMDEELLSKLNADQTSGFDNSFKVLEKLERVKATSRNKPDLIEKCSNFHLVFKETKWLDVTTLKKITDQFCRDGDRLILEDAFSVLNKIVKECGMELREENMKEAFRMTENCYFLTIINTYPEVVGMGVNADANEAKYMAAFDLLTRMCILYK